MKKRFIKSVIDTAAKETTAMPWSRGATRTTFITKRAAILPKKKSA